MVSVQPGTPHATKRQRGVCIQHYLVNGARSRLNVVLELLDELPVFGKYIGGQRLLLPLVVLFVHGDEVVVRRNPDKREHRPENLLEHEVLEAVALDDRGREDQALPLVLRQLLTELVRLLVLEDLQKHFVVLSYLQ